MKTIEEYALLTGQPLSEVQRGIAIEKIIQAFQMLNEGLDKGRTIKPNSDMHHSIKLLLKVWNEINTGSQPVGENT